jgi:hypothetical protein
MHAGASKPFVGNDATSPRRLLAVVAEADMAYPGLRYGRERKCVENAEAGKA